MYVAITIWNGSTECCTYNLKNPVCSEKIRLMMLVTIHTLGNGLAGKSKYYGIRSDAGSRAR